MGIGPEEGGAPAADAAPEESADGTEEGGAGAGAGEETAVDDVAAAVSVDASSLASPL